MYCNAVEAGSSVSYPLALLHSPSRLQLVFALLLICLAFMHSCSQHLQFLAMLQMTEQEWQSCGCRCKQECGCAMALK